MEMHRALRLARRARGERDQADVGRRRVRRLEVRAFAGAQRLQRVRAAVAPCNDPLQSRRERPRALQFLREPVVAERQRDLRLVKGISDFSRAQQRHGGDDNAAGFQHRQIDGGHRHSVGGAQQHPIAGLQPELVGEDIADAIHPRLQLAIGKAFIDADDAETVALSLSDPAVEQRGDAIQPLGIAELLAGENQVGPLIARRQVVARETVQMAARNFRFNFSHAKAPWRRRGPTRRDATRLNI